MWHHAVGVTVPNLAKDLSVVIFGVKQCKVTLYNIVRFQILRALLMKTVMLCHINCQRFNGVSYLCTHSFDCFTLLRKVWQTSEMVVSITPMSQLNTHKDLYPCLWNPLPFSIDGGIISIVTVLQARRTGVQFLAGATYFSLLLNIQHSSTAPSPSSSILCLGVQQLGHKVDRLPPCTGKLKNDWSCTFTLLMAWTRVTLLFPLLRNDKWWPCLIFFCAK